jgi:uncharacterized lipoprotein
MRTAMLLLSLVVLSGCGTTEGYRKSQTGADTAAGENARRKPTLLERMGLWQPPVKKTEVLPPVSIDRSTEDAFVPAQSPELAPYVRPGSLSVDPDRVRS